MVKPGNASQHVAKALDMLRAARVLNEAGMAARAAAQGYYAVFHMAEALLASIGQATETHAGVHTLLARHFVRHGPLPSDASQRFSHLMSDRLNADYGVDWQIDEAGGRRSLLLAAGLLADMLRALGEADAGAAGPAMRAEIAALSPGPGAR